MEAARKISKAARATLEKQAWIKEYNSSNLNSRSHVAQEISPHFTTQIENEFHGVLRSFNDPELNALLDDKTVRSQCNYQTIPMFIKGILVDNEKKEERIEELLNEIIEIKNKLKKQRNTAYKKTVEAAASKRKT